MADQIVLVPGFLGFASMGGIDYFNGVEALLKKHLEQQGVQAEVHQVPTHPTASIRQRAAAVLEAIVGVSRASSGDIHLIGHSTGGLDARLAIAPSASLPTDAELEDYRRIRSLVALSTPHYGTPLAAIVGGAMGKPLLRVLAVLLAFALRHGRLPLRLALRAGGYWNRLDDHVGLEDTVGDRVYEELLTDFSAQRRQELIELIEQVSADQSLLFQLTPAGCDLLNAGTGDPENLRYGCVLTKARPLGLGSFLAHRHDPYAQSLHFWFRLAYLATSRATEAHVAPLDADRREALEAVYGSVPSVQANDGFVPTLSQLWGELIHGAKADHLDVVGHFRAPGRADFLPSASGFDEDAFDALWSDVAAFIAG